MRKRGTRRSSGKMSDLFICIYIYIYTYTRVIRRVDERRGIQWKFEKNNEIEKKQRARPRRVSGTPLAQPYLHVYDPWSVDDFIYIYIYTYIRERTYNTCFRTADGPTGMTKWRRAYYIHSVCRRRIFFHTSFRRPDPSPPLTNADAPDITYAWYAKNYNTVPAERIHYIIFFLAHMYTIAILCDAYVLCRRIFSKVLPSRTVCSTFMPYVHAYVRAYYCIVHSTRTPIASSMRWHETSRLDFFFFHSPYRYEIRFLMN
jgi:hypothetical protein